MNAWRCGMKRSCMRTFLDILTASLITIILYIGLYFIWGAIARESQNEKLFLILLSTMTSIVYAVILFCITKVRKDRGEKELLKTTVKPVYIRCATIYL